MSKIYYVREMALQVGIHPDTIRELSKRGLLPDVRNYNNWRVYSEQDIETLKTLCGGERQRKNF